MPAMILSTFIGFLMGTVLQPAMVPFSDITAQTLWREMPYKCPDINFLIALRHRRFCTKEVYHHYAKRLGYENEVSDAMLEAAKKKMDIRDLITLYRREVIDKETYNLISSTMGLSAETISFTKKAMEYYPNPQDFIRFAVRDVYNENVVSNYGYDEDYPSTIDADVKKAGVEPKWMKYFWRAHWMLPSVQQGYEMMHRGEITKEDLDTLLRISDIPKYWRDKLIAISYNPFTRVDVRRMYKLGVLDSKEVLQAYKDIGYNDDKAAKLQQFTLKYGIEEPKNASETKIKESFMRGNINSDEANKMLWGLGYDQEAANFIFSLWDYDKFWNDVQQNIDDLKVQFLYGDITEEEFTDKITALALPEEGKNKVVSETLSTKSRMKQLPTKSDITKWFNAKIIDEDKFKDYLSQLGYGDIYIQNYLMETKVSGAEDFRVPTKADYLAFYNNKIIDAAMWIDGMFSLGYNDVDIIRYASLYKINIEDVLDVREKEVS